MINVLQVPLDVIWQHRLEVSETTQALFNHPLDVFISFLFMKVRALRQVLLKDDLAGSTFPFSRVEEQVEQLKGLDREAGGEAQGGRGFDRHSLFTRV